MLPPALLPDVESTFGTWVDAAIAIGIAIGVAFVVYVILSLFLRRAFRSFADETRVRLRRALLKPLGLLLPLLAVQLALPGARLPAAVLDIARHAISIGLIVAVLWLVLGLTTLAETLVLRRYDMGARDNLHARRVTTQVKVIRRVLVVVLVVIGVAAVLMTFPRVRQLGTSLLASAGIAGLVLGLAARPAIENIIAGLQIAFTEPVRLDDVVVIDGAWGRIEEITTTYVVVRIWDQRRLIVPFTRLLSNSFENWTRTTAEILGTVYLYADYTVDVDAMREELQRIVKDSGKWNGKTVGLVVTDAKPEGLELRALVSADDSGAAWDLRCEVREKLVAWLKREFPESLPRVRAEVRRPGPAPAG